MANTQHSIATYVSDLLAIEKHLRASFQNQLDDAEFREYQDTADVVTRLAALADEHVVSLGRALELLGSHEAAPVKDAVSGVGGAVAGIIDKVRKTKISKALRDDFGAIAFATASYTELLATADVTGSADISTLAQRHLEDYAGLLVDLGDCIPAVVVRELAELGLSIPPGASEGTRRTIRNSWRARVPETTRGEIPATDVEIAAPAFDV